MKKANTQKLVVGAILAALVVVVQLICTFVKFGPFSITLALAPMLVGAALYGRKMGAILGAVLGTFILITGFLAWDGGFILMMFDANPIALVLVCILKTTVAGYVSGLIYEKLEKKNLAAAVITSGIACPLVNTGLFVVALVIFFNPMFLAMAGGKNLLIYIITGLTGVNFLVELGVNLVLSTGITTVIKAVKKSN